MDQSNLYLDNRFRLCLQIYNPISGPWRWGPPFSYFARHATCDWRLRIHTRERMSELMNSTCNHPGFSPAVSTQGRACGSAGETFSAPARLWVPERFQKSTFDGVTVECQKCRYSGILGTCSWFLLGSGEGYAQAGHESAKGLWKRNPRSQFGPHHQAALTVSFPLFIFL